MVFVGLIIGMSVISVLLFSEYIYFKKQSEKFLTLQEDYHTYIMAVNKILQDYNRTKERLEEIGVVFK